MGHEQRSGRVALITGATGMVGPRYWMRWLGGVNGVTRVTVRHLHGAYLRIDATKLQGRVFQDFHVKAVEGVVPLAALEPTWLLRPVK